MGKDLDALKKKVKILEAENKKLRDKIDLPDFKSILSRRLRIEKAIFEISSLFIGEYQQDQSIQTSIELLGNLTSADRTYFYRFHHRAKLFHITHEWINSTIKGVNNPISSLSSEELKWWTEQLKAKDFIFIRNVSELPVKAINERNIFIDEGVSSVVAYPIRIKSKLEGFIGFDHGKTENTWSPEDLEIIRIATDIIGFSLERKRSEKSLRRSEEMYQNIFDNTGAATVTLKSDTTIKMVNSEFERLIGLPRDQIEKKKKLTDLVDKKDRQIIRRYHHLLLSKPEAVPKNYEFDYINNDGETRNAFMTGSTLLDSRTIVISFIDITDFKNVERQLRIAIEKAEESDNLKSAFLANVSHEIRTPLNAITGFSGLLSNPDLPLDKKESYIKQILNGSNELVSLIDNVLDISRIESGTMKTKVAEFLLNVKLKEIKDFYDDYKAHHGKENLKIKLNLPSGCENLLLKTDPVKLHQILGNLIDNAIKFTSSGSIEIGYSFLPGQNKDEPVENILFFIKDTGIGIAKKDREAIFERFVKIIDKGGYLYRGAGLGLTLARDLVHLLEGEIWVESMLGKGSTFYFTLPHDKPKVAKKKTKSAKLPLEDFSDKLIMIAEDTESNFLYLKELLSPTKINVIRAKDGQDAIDVFRENKDKIDIILMDILMPEYDGFEAASRIRKIKKDACIIAQTAFTFEGEMENGLYAGCFDDYILKPFDIKFIINILHKYLSEGE